MALPAPRTITGICKNPGCHREVKVMVRDLTREEVLEKLASSGRNDEIVCSGWHLRNGTTPLDNFDWELPEK
jgi:hypothetical protein